MLKEKKYIITVVYLRSLKMFKNISLLHDTFINGEPEKSLIVFIHLHRGKTIFQMVVKL